MSEIEDFVDALYGCVNSLTGGGDATYSMKAIHILDARNHLFRVLPSAVTDESCEIYSLSDLCMMNETYEMVPDRKRMYKIARNYWG